MNIGILSDLHVEFEEYSEPFPECDVLVLAGDLHDAQPSEHRRLLNNKINNFNNPIIRIKGNHEFYNTIESTINYNPMDDCFIKVIDNIVFICAIGWSNPSDLSWNNTNDKYINGITLKRIREWSKLHWKFIEDSLELYRRQDTVVVTHYLPSERSVAPRFIGNFLNPSFVSAHDELIKEYKPLLWIHGHTHDSFDYNIGETRVVCNPRGYAKNGRNENDQFQPYKVVNVQTIGGHNA